jgi:hypothetical protein
MQRMARVSAATHPPYADILRPAAIKAAGRSWIASGLRTAPRQSNDAHVVALATLPFKRWDKQRACAVLAQQREAQTSASAVIRIMALINDYLTLWEIGFRWADRDPDGLRFFIPLPVRDNFRTLMSAIIEGHLYCSTLGLEKYGGAAREEAKHYIRYWLDEVNACIWSQRFNRALLKWATIDRWAFQAWCTGQGIPLPEFWFPPGWKIDYEWPLPSGAEASLQEGAMPTNSAKLDEGAATRETMPQVSGEMAPNVSAESGAGTGQRALDRRQRARIACQEVARRLWVNQPTSSLKAIAVSREVQEIAPGSEYELAVVQRWMSEVDPRDASTRRGRKKK